MRCDNCGWNNPDGLTKCQKCNQELKSVPSLAQTILHPSRNHSVDAQETVNPISCVRCGYPLSADAAFCPNCGTQVVQIASRSSSLSQNAKTVRILPEEFLEDGHKEVLKETVRELPAELLVENPESKNVDNKKTVRILPEEFLQDDIVSVDSVMEQDMTAHPEFKLVPIDNFDGHASNTMCYSGNSISVVREDIPGADSSVDANIQVEFEYEDGHWVVSEKEGKKMVFVAASHKIPLESGDIIVIGNRRYVFE